MRAAVLAAALALAGCGPTPLQYGIPAPDATFADTWGRNRGDDALNADAAACNYDVTRMQLASGPVFPGVWHQCMAARGWRQIR